MKRISPTSASFVLAAFGRASAPGRDMESDLPRPAEKEKPAQRAAIKVSVPQIGFLAGPPVSLAGVGAARTDTRRRTARAGKRRPGGRAAVGASVPLPGVTTGLVDDRPR